MKLTEIKMDWPVCPKDNQPLLDTNTKGFSESQQEIKNKWDSCEHVFPERDENSMSYVFEESCTKCDYTAGTMMFPMAKVFYCPHCGTVYSVEDIKW